MKVEQEVMNGNIVPFTLDDLWQLRKELKEAIGDDLDGKLADFAERTMIDPQSIPEDSRFMAYMVLWMMKLIPQDINQN